MKEEWKTIKEYEGLYYISNKGRIYSVKARNGKGDLIKGRVSNNGHQIVMFIKDGEKTLKHVARLVLEIFVRVPNFAEQAIHKDGNLLNNCLDNLEWGRSRKKAIYQFPAEINEVLTLEEFADKYKLTNPKLEVILGINSKNIVKYLAGEYQFTKKVIERLGKLGIDVSRRRTVAKEQIKKEYKSPINKRVKSEKNDIVKPFHLAAMMKFGNTIISKKHSKEEIINEFKKYGYDVQIREFGPCPISDMKDERTHYVVTQVGRGELYVK